MSASILFHWTLWHFCEPEITQGIVDISHFQCCISLGTRTLVHQIHVPSFKYPAALSSSDHNYVIASFNIVRAMTNTISAWYRIRIFFRGDHLVKCYLEMWITGLTREPTFSDSADSKNTYFKWLCGELNAKVWVILLSFILVMVLYIFKFMFNFSNRSIWKLITGVISQDLTHKNRAGNLDQINIFENNIRHVALQRT